MRNDKFFNFFFGVVKITAPLALVANQAFAQVQLTGQGGSEIMMFLARITNFAFIIAITACTISLMIAGFKFSKGDQQGMDMVWKAVIGTAIVAGASGILKYWIFAAQDTGLTNTNTNSPF